MRRRDILGLIGGLLVVPAELRAQSLKAALRAPSPNLPLRIVVVANKAFEADPLMAVMGNDWARSPSLDNPRDAVWPRRKPQQVIDIISKPRCLIDVDAQGTPAARVEIWCLDDLMSQPINHSGSDNKALALARIADFGPAPDGVIAFGTGAFPGDTSNNGCVAVGSTLFIHDAAGGQSHWSWTDHMEKLVASKTPASFYSSIAEDQATMKSIRDELLTVPVRPAADLRLIIASNAVAISSVNIASSADYTKIDNEAMAAATAAGATNITSVETTHGVIRAQWPEAPFIYVTGIPNRVGHFADEANKNYPQNFVAAHNAGVATSYLISFFTRAISQ
jgi:hypothetical protein